MTRKSTLVVVAVAAGIVAVGLLALPKRAQWTTDSDAALIEFEASMEASRKLYGKEARDHLERALELDPDFIAAKVRMAEACRYEDEAHAEALMDEVMAADQSLLNPRERFMIERYRLLNEQKFDEANAQLDDYLERHPDDPYVLHIKALQSWQRGDLEEGERLNKRLLEISPNWVLAYNQLGYITMMQGRFNEAEEYFTSYRFIAPDQANPHDSLGELFIVLGRYDEARASLEQALVTKPDFIPAYEHLAMVEALQGQWEAAKQRIEEATELLPEADDAGRRMRCALDFWKLANERRWEDLLDLAESQCPTEKSGDLGPTHHLHNAACHLGRWDITEAIETRLEEMLDTSESGKHSRSREMMEPMLHRMIGTRLIQQGELQAGIEELEMADQQLTFINAGFGIAKLSNKLNLAHAYRQAGMTEKATAMVNQVRSINPEIVIRYEERLAEDD